MDKRANKKWKCLYVLSILSFVAALVIGGSYFMSAEDQLTKFRKAFAIGFLALAVGGFLVAKIGSWFFHDD